jgi:putative aldouronate transport system substrate-binding protein
MEEIMKKLSRVVLGSVCTVLAAAALLTGCKKNESKVVAGDENTPGWSIPENVKQKVKFDWYVNFSWFARHWGDSKVSKYITEKTGVDINFIVPAGNEAEKLNTMIAGDVLPDLITLGWYEGQVPLMIESGYVCALDELAEQYDPYFFKAANAQKLNWYRQKDGHVYGYPNASFTPSDYEKYAGKLTSNETFLVRKDLYETLGRPDMSTPEGFLKALRNAKAMFPKVNGQNLIPFGTTEFSDVGCSQLQATLAHFLAISPEEDGKYVDVNLGLTENPEYLRWLKVLRTAYQEKLLTKEMFIDKRSQIEEKASNGRYFCMLYQNWDMQTAQNTLYANDPDSIYIAVPGPKNSKGDDPVLAGGGISGWTITMISKKCKDKGKAIQFLTYLISEEGQMDTNFGIQGETWEYDENGVPCLLPEIRALDSENKNRQETEIGVQYTYWMLMDTAWQTQFPVEYAPSLGQPQLWTVPYVHSYAVYDGLTIPSGSDEDLIYADIQRKWGKVLPDLIQARSDEEFDEIVAEFNAYKRSKGIDKVQKLQTKLMNENKLKLR